MTYKAARKGRVEQTNINDTTLKHINSAISPRRTRTREPANQTESLMINTADAGSIWWRQVASYVGSAEKRVYMKSIPRV